MTDQEARPVPAVDDWERLTPDDIHRLALIHERAEPWGYSDRLRILAALRLALSGDRTRLAYVDPINDDTDEFLSVRLDLRAVMDERIREHGTDQVPSTAETLAEDAGVPTAEYLARRQRPRPVCAEPCAVCRVEGRQQPGDYVCKKCGHWASNGIHDDDHPPVGESGEPKETERP